MDKLITFLKQLLEPIMPIWNNYVKPVTSQTIEILPDSILLGTGLLALLTFSPAYFIFFLSIIEFSLIQRLLSAVLTSISPTFEKKNGCSTGYNLGSLYRFSIINTLTNDASVPNPLIFIISAASFYFYTMYINLNQSYAAIGQPMMNTVAGVTIISGILMLVIILWRSFVNGCESFTNLFISFVLGLLGVGVFYQNLKLFGIDLINMNGIPILQPTQICGPPTR